MNAEKPDNKVEFAEDEQPWRPGVDDADVEADNLPTGRFSAENDDPQVADEADQHLEAAVGANRPDADINTVADDPADEQPEAAVGEDDTAEDGDVEQETTGTVQAVEPEITTEAVLEAVLFAADEPFTPNKLAEIVGAGSVKDIKDQIKQLNNKYEQMACSFRIEAIAGGFQMLTLPAFNPWLQKLMRARSETKLSPAALETLAIIAYKQPILRVDIEAIRGVACGEMVRQLSDKGLVKIVGRAEVLGRPLLYGTTKRFLEVFGLNSLKDLPTAEDLKKPG